MATLYLEIFEVIVIKYHGAKAPGHQYPQCWLNIRYIRQVSFRNITAIGKIVLNKITFWQKNTQHHRLALWRQIPVLSWFCNVQRLCDKIWHITSQLIHTFTLWMKLFAYTWWKHTYVIHIQLYPFYCAVLWCVQIIEYFLSWWSYSFVCILHYLIINIMQTYLKVLNF